MTNLANLLPLAATSGRALKQGQPGNGDAAQTLESLGQGEQFATMFAELQNLGQALSAIPQDAEQKHGQFNQNNILALLSLIANKQSNAETLEQFIGSEQKFGADLTAILPESILPPQIVGPHASELDFEQAYAFLNSVQNLNQNLDQDIELQSGDTQIIAETVMPQPPVVPQSPPNIQVPAIPSDPATVESTDVNAQNGDLQSEIEQKPQAIVNGNSQTAIPVNQPNMKTIAADKPTAAGFVPNMLKQDGPNTALPHSSFNDDAAYDDNDQRQAPVMAKEMKVTVIKQETHFAPPSQLSLAQQITDRIIGQSDKLDTRIASPDVITNSKPAETSVKVLQIQLSPPDLGMLTMRMSLKADVLNLHLQTANPKTAALIQSDREALAGLLRVAGYMVDGLQIQVTPSEKGTGGQALSSGSGHFQPGQSHSGGNQSNSGTAGQSWQQQDNENYNIREGDAQAESRLNRPDRDAVYI